MSDEIAERLADMRREHGYSQEALASELGLSRQAISKWERGESQPDTSNLIALADLYDVTLDELIRPYAAKVETEETEVGEADEFVERVTAEEAKVADPTPSSESAAPAGTVDSTASSDAGESGEPNASCASTDIPRASQGPSCPNAQYAPPQVHPVYVEPQRHDPLKTFPYPVLVAIIYLFAGLVFGIWHPTWIIFLTIPFYYWMVKVISDDRKQHEERFDGTPYTQG